MNTKTLIATVIITGVLLATGCMKSAGETSTGSEFPMRPEEPGAAVLLDTDPWENPAPGEEMNLGIEITNKMDKKLPEDKYMIGLYYRPIKITNITKQGQYKTQTTNTPFQKIKIWKKDIPPANKTQYGYKTNLDFEYTWTLPGKEQEFYEIRLALEKEIDGEEATKILTWNAADVLTTIGKQKIKNYKQGAQKEACEAGGSIEITDYSFQQTEENEGNLEVQVKNNGENEIETKSVDYITPTGGGGATVTEELLPLKTTSIETTVYTGSFENVTEIQVKTICPSINATFQIE